jgi:signal transduction histidine kinase/NO-binding membrane sensor protein with MHYT domain/DNA-binding response OmpR family regulator
MEMSYNYGLVALSYLIAAYASFAVLGIAKRIYRDKHKLNWLGVGSITMGLGIWSMHFVGMLAMKMDMPIQYDPFLTFVSGLIAVIASMYALYIIGWKRMTLPRLTVSAIIMGLGIATMHYVGMAAIIVNADISYEPVLFSLSVLIAIGASFAAMWISIRLASHQTRYDIFMKVASAMVMGVAVAGMHYVGMAAAIFSPTDKVIEVVSLDQSILVMSITAITALVITSGIIATTIGLKKHNNRRTLLLVMTLATATVTVSSFGANLLYDIYQKEWQGLLSRKVEDNASLISAVSRFDSIHSTQDVRGGATEATLSQIKDAYSFQAHPNDPSEHQEEFYFFVKEKDRIKIIIADVTKNDFASSNIESDAQKSKPFRLALANKKGILIGKHFARDENVIAAYAGIPEIQAGIISLLSINDIRQPFLIAIAVTSILGFVVIVISAAFINGITRPMLTSLETEVKNRIFAEKELKEFNARLENLVDDRTTELSEALETARIAAKSKATFLANMSHEIRTPMNGVLGMLQLMENTRMNKKQTEYIETAQRSADVLLTLINDILDLSKIESGNLSLEKTDFNIEDAVQDVAALLSEKAHQKHLELITYIASNVPRMLVGDPTRIRQILFNLAGNAIKFTRQGEVVIRVMMDRASAKDQFIRFEITDTGIGIAEEHIDKIFDTFQQADGSTTRQYGGTGLGLTICKQLIQLMGGNVSVRSKPDMGSTFSFVIKLGTSTSIPSEELDRHSLDGKHALIIDDNETNRTILQEQLNSWGLTHDSARSGREGLQMLRQSGRHYDIILLDMMMPEMDGLQMVKELRDDHDIEAVPIIMLTSMTASNMPETDAADMIAASLSKPVKQSVLLDTILNVLQQKITPVVKQHAHQNNTDNDVDMKQLRILVAEDNHVNREVVKGMLHHLGYKADFVGNGEEALSLSTANKYDVILMDVQMPRLDGLEATRMIRAHEADSGQHTPIIAMTANAMQGDEERCRQAGMDDYLSKPVVLTTLSAKLAAYE